MDNESDNRGFNSSFNIYVDWFERIADMPIFIANSINGTQFTLLMEFENTFQYQLHHQSWFIFKFNNCQGYFVDNLDIMT